MRQVPESLHQALTKLGLIAEGQVVTGEPLTGGVSSDIWRINFEGKSVCVKRALAQLKVSQDWRASVDRNAYEVAWFKTVANIVPDSVPRILGHDPVAGVFVMEFLPPEHYALWKSQLRDGVVNLDTVSALATTLVHIHNRTASDDAIASQFDHDDLFFSLRLEPYLYATAQRHPDVDAPLSALVTMITANKKTLVHGDISPKNILVGPRGPIIIDAECAWYGDPAFDVAFCLNHLMLKCIWNPSASVELMAGFDLLAKTYLSAVAWESRDALEQRVAKLLPGLMLARIDGKSPVEYINEDVDKERVRTFAKTYLLKPVDKLNELSEAWVI